MSLLKAFLKTPFRETSSVAQLPTVERKLASMLEVKLRDLAKWSASLGGPGDPILTDEAGNKYATCKQVLQCIDYPGYYTVAKDFSRFLRDEGYEDTGEATRFAVPVDSKGTVVKAMCVRLDSVESLVPTWRSRKGAKVINDFREMHGLKAA